MLPSCNEPPSPAAQSRRPAPGPDGPTCPSAGVSLLGTAGAVGAHDPGAGASCGLCAAGLGWEAQGGAGFSGQKRAFGGLKPDGRKKEMRGKPDFLWRLREKGTLQEGIPSFCFLEGELLLTFPGSCI